MPDIHTPTPKRRVHLYGALKKYGPTIEMRVGTPIQAFRALMTNHPETRQFIERGGFKVIIGDRRKGQQLGEDELSLHGSKDIHIVPTVKGRGGRGGTKIVMGAAIIAAAYFAAPMMYAGADAAFMTQAGVANYANMGAAAFTAPLVGGVSYGAIASVGVSMMLAGAFQALSPTPKAADYAGREAPDQRASFLYNGPTNAVEQGAAIPLVYGKMRTGSVLVSAGLSVEQI